MKNRLVILGVDFSANAILGKVETSYSLNVDITSVDVPRLSPVTIYATSELQTYNDDVLMGSVPAPISVDATNGVVATVGDPDGSIYPIVIDGSAATAESCTITIAQIGSSNVATVEAICQIYAIKRTTNAPVMDVVYNAGWAASPDYMTFDEAAKVTTFGTAFNNNTEITTFEEAMYFTGLTTLNGAFKSSSIQTLILDFEGNNANAIDISTICRACDSLVEVVIRNAKIKFGGNEFNDCDQLVTIRLENCDTSESTSLAYTLANTKAIESTDFLNGNDWSNVTNLGAFLRSSNVKRASFPATFSSKLTSIAEVAYGVPELEELDLSNLVWDNVTNYSTWAAPYVTKLHTINVGQGMCKATELRLPGLYWDPILKRIDGYFDAGNTTVYAPDYGAGPCRRIEIRNIGKRSELVSFKMSVTSNWGVNSNDVLDAEESLIDSMHYLHDRVASGFETCTLILSAATKNVLNKYPDLVAEVVSKGYTIA